MSTHESELMTLLMEVREKVSAIGAKQDETNRRLFGNGQPGVIDKFDSRLTSLEEHRSEEKGERKSNRKWTAIVSAIISAVISWAFQHWSK